MSQKEAILRTDDNVVISTASQTAGMSARSRCSPFWAASGQMSAASMISTVQPEIAFLSMKN